MAETGKKRADGAREWDLCLGDLDREELEGFGRILDQRPARLRGRTVGMALAERLLVVRSREGKPALLKANATQRAFERRRGERNIVLKARQMGLTTWAAARFFLKSITQPGTLTLEVAHTQEAAEEIFRIVHRFVDWLPEELRAGPLKTSRSNVRQIVFPELDAQYRVVSAGDRNAGRGLTVQNLHCSELARWPGDPAETLAGLRASMAPGAELILESTPDGVGGCFHEEWQKAGETGMVRHFFPWWMERRYRAGAVDEASLSEEERTLMGRHRLDREQIGYRRQIRADFRGLARQEYAEDEESCFLASGNSVFELEAIEARLAEATPPMEQRRNGELEIWLPPLKGKEYLVAVDPAGGGSEGDYSAAQVLELETGLQCAEFAGHVGGLELARLATALAAEYNQAWLVVERNNHGTGVLALAETVCAYKRIYKQGGRQTGQPGWLTTSLSRPAVLGQLGAGLVEEPERFQSRRLLGECRSFVRMPDGRTGARAGTHDDRVMAMAIGLGARAELLEGKRRGYLQAKDLVDTVSGVMVTHDVALWNGNDTSLSTPTTTQYMGVIPQIVAGGLTTTIATTASIVDGIKSAVAQMVASNGYYVRPTAIYANPVLLDLIDREMKTEFNVVLNTDNITGGIRVKMLSTQAGDLPLIPDWSLSYTGTPGSGTAVLPAYIVTEDLIEYHWLGDPTPRIFQLGLPNSMTYQYVAVKFGAPVVKGANYAHYQVLVDR